jgi:hypothetical protein
VAQARDVSAHWSLGDIVKENDDVSHMTQSQAYDYCLNQNPESERKAIKEALDKNQIPAKGIYLPLARQLAQYSQTLGARGISETAHPGMVRSAEAVKTEIAEMDKDGFLPIFAKNSAGQPVVDFYFNYSGYQRPAGDLGNYFFWSSSVHPDYFDGAYNLNGDGFIFFAYRSDCYYGSAVRCARSR